MEFEEARKYKKQIKKLYKSSFPFNERAPLYMLYKKAENGGNLFYAVLEQDTFVGLVYTMTGEKIVYVFFLAVTRENRGRGYGSRILEKIKERNKDKTVILMIEDTREINVDNIQERIKRLEFYEKNGFSRLNININEAGVKYEILGTDAKADKEDFFALMKNFMGGFLFRIIYRKNRFD